MVRNAIGKTGRGAMVFAGDERLRESFADRLRTNKSRNAATSQRTNSATIQDSAAPARDYVIGRGDLLTVEVFDIPELTRDLRVSQTGTVGIPLVPVRLYVAGLTELQTQQKIAEVLEADGLISNPRVMVSVKEKKSKPITVVGAVAHPMVYQADRHGDFDSSAGRSWRNFGGCW